jgi:hypothetical protein
MKGKGSMGHKPTKRSSFCSGSNTQGRFLTSFIYDGVDRAKIKVVNNFMFVFITLFTFSSFFSALAVRPESLAYLSYPDVGTYAKSFRCHSRAVRKEGRDS